LGSCGKDDEAGIQQLLEAISLSICPSLDMSQSVKWPFSSITFLVYVAYDAILFQHHNSNIIGSVRLLGGIVCISKVSGRPFPFPFLVLGELPLQFHFNMWMFLEFI
jgi:hypothetical protein